MMTPTHLSFTCHLCTDNAEQKLEEKERGSGERQFWCVRWQEWSEYLHQQWVWQSPPHPSLAASCRPNASLNSLTNRLSSPFRLVELHSWCQWSFLTCQSECFSVWCHLYHDIRAFTTLTLLPSPCFRMCAKCVTVKSQNPKLNQDCRSTALALS